MAVGIFAWLFLKEPTDGRVFLSIPIVVVGVVFVPGVVGAGAYGDDPALGVIYGVATSIAYSVFILVHRENARDLDRPAGPLFEATLAATLYGSCRTPWTSRRHGLRTDGSSRSR